MSLPQYQGLKLPEGWGFFFGEYWGRYKSGWLNANDLIPGKVMVNFLVTSLIFPVNKTLTVVLAELNKNLTANSLGSVLINKGAYTVPMANVTKNVSLV